MRSILITLIVALCYASAIAAPVSFNVNTTRLLQVRTWTGRTDCGNGTSLPTLGTYYSTDFCLGADKLVCSQNGLRRYSGCTKNSQGCPAATTCLSNPSDDTASEGTCIVNGANSYWISCQWAEYADPQQDLLIGQYATTNSTCPDTAAGDSLQVGQLCSPMDNHTMIQCGANGLEVYSCSQGCMEVSVVNASTCLPFIGTVTAPSAVEDVCLPSGLPSLYVVLQCLAVQTPPTESSPQSNPNPGSSPQPNPGSSPAPNPNPSPNPQSTPSPSQSASTLAASLALLMAAAALLRH